MKPKDVGAFIDVSMGLPETLHLATMPPYTDPLRLRGHTAIEAMRNLRERGMLEEPPAEPLGPLPDDYGSWPDAGQWARQRSRHTPSRLGRTLDEPYGKWHLMVWCKHAENGHDCCPVRGACGTKLDRYEATGGLVHYIERVDEPPDDACRKCLDSLARQRAGVADLRKLAER